MYTAAALDRPTPSDEPARARAAPASDAPKGEAVFAPGLPVEVERGGWWGRVAKTLGVILVTANRSFMAVEEPVKHGPVLSFIASLRLPTWGVLVVVALIDWFAQPGDVEAQIRTTAATRILGLQLGQVMAAWVVILTPLRIPIIYFFVGLSAHIVMTLTGGAHRSIGASMRAMGFALAPAAMVFGVLELMAARGALHPTFWLYVFASWLVIGWGLSSIALSRTHGATLVRGFAVALVPVLLFGLEAMGSAMFQLPWDPFTGEPPPIKYMLPPP